MILGGKYFPAPILVGFT